MEKVIDFIQHANETLNGIVWGVPMLALILGTGIFLSLRTKFFQLTKLKIWFGETFLAIFKNRKVTKTKEKRAISQFQALSTALAATIGTGNIAGVATAITVGGPGAVFWMWVSALFGMMTSYGENVLGIYYRTKNEKGEWSGGPMYYLQEGLKNKKVVGKLAKPLSILFALFCIMASFGIGNMSQVNNISTSLKKAFVPVGGTEIPPLVTGIVLAVFAGLVILGGIKRIGKVTEKLVPFMALFYIAGTLFIFFANFKNAGSVFGSIFKGAFGLQAAAGGISGTLIKQAVSMGFKRGVFSNEAGLGSAVMVNSASDVAEPAVQGMWGIFEVFCDTMVVCTLTAFSILSTNVVNLETGEVLTGLQGSELVTYAFSNTIHSGAGIFIAIATFFFAFSTVLGWSFYGTKAVEFLFGTKATYIYKIIFVLFIVVGATMDLSLAWEISDTLNGLMALPNLIGVLFLSSTVVAVTRSYLKRKVTKESTASKPMLSAYDAIQTEMELKLAEDE